MAGRKTEASATHHNGVFSPTKESSLGGDAKINSNPKWGEEVRLLLLGLFYYLKIKNKTDTTIGVKGGGERRRQISVELCF